MRNNFWKWLKRFFVVLPIIFLLVNLSIFVLRQNGENLQLQDQDTIFNTDFIGQYLFNGFDEAYNSTDYYAYNPLFNFRMGSGDILHENSIMYKVNSSFNNMMVFLIGDNSYDTTSLYVPLICNFFTWWVFVELVFLFFRFVTFLISWINSLFDNTFKKIKK